MDTKVNLLMCLLEHTPMQVRFWGRRNLATGNIICNSNKQNRTPTLLQVLVAISSTRSS